MCFGFLGLQFAFALQNANVSRIFQTLGANVDDPDAVDRRAADRLLVQPVIGYLSDRTWTGLGPAASVFPRRRGARFAGAVRVPERQACGSPPACCGSSMPRINVSMEPFRAFVGDQLAPVQRPAGLRDAELLHRRGFGGRQPVAVDAGKGGRGQHADAQGQVPDTVRYAFYAGGVVLLGAMAWTVLRTREYSPAELAAFDDAELEHAAPNSRTPEGDARQWSAQALACLVARRRRLVRGRAFPAWTSSCTCWRQRHRRPTASPAHRQRLHRGDGISPSCATCGHAAGDAPAGAGAVLLVVRAVRDVDLHHAGGDLGALRRHRSHIGGVQRRRQLGPACCSAYNASPRWPRS